MNKNIWGSSTLFLSLAGVDAGILKRGALRISDEEGPTMVVGDVLEIFENYTP